MCRKFTGPQIAVLWKIKVKAEVPGRPRGTEEAAGWVKRDVRAPESPHSPACTTWVRPDLSS